MIPYSRQNITAADIRAVAVVLRAERITQGPMIEKFERLLARYAHTRYAVAFSSGTAALHAAYFAAGIGKGDEIIVPALTFAATANCALYLGAKPVFADVGAHDGLISPEDVKKKITKRTKAIVPVDYAGRPADLHELRALAKKHNLVLIEDAAQSLGASYRGKSVGTQADMTMFSFHPVKSITTGEGGAVVTNSRAYYEKLRAFRTHGIVKERRLFRAKSVGAWHQEMQLLGYNYRLTDIQAALGVSQMKRLGAHIAKRRMLARRYAKLLKNISGLTLPPADGKRVRSAWHLYAIRVPKPRRKAIFNALRKAGIGVQVHHVPVYLHPYYRKLGYRQGLCPNAEHFYASEISLPLYPALSKREQDKVVRILKKLMAQ